MCVAHVRMDYAWLARSGSVASRRKLLLGKWVPSLADNFRSRNGYSRVISIVSSVS